MIIVYNNINIQTFFYNFEFIFVGNPKSLLPMPVEDASMRRSCSLSDLHMGNLGKSK